MKEELIKEMEYNLNLVMDYNEYSEDCGYGDQNYIEFEYNKMAKELIDMGWTKQVWHKVAEGDLPKEYHEVRFVSDAGHHHNGYFVKAHNAFYKDGDIKYDIDEVIAWTELPKYGEKEND